MPNHDAERALLGCLLVNGDAVWKVLELITIDDLSFDAHRRLFNTIVDAVKAGKPSDLIVVTDMLEKNGDLEKVGGAVFLAELLDGSHSAANVEHYAELVRIESVRDRFKYEVTASYHRMADSPDPEKTLFDLLRRLGKIGAGKQKDCDMHRAVAGAMRHIEKLQSGKLPGYSFGREFSKLNSLTFGILPELYVIAARPSQGKTSLADQISRNLEAQGIIPHYFSLEMSEDILALRRIYSKTGEVIPDFDERMIAAKQIDPALIARSGSEVSQGKTKIHDSIFDSDKIVSTIRAAAMSEPNTAAFVDHLQLMKLGQARGENRNDAIGRAMSDFKSIVQDLRIPVFILSQLTRGPEKDDREPVLADLRDSGNIEQDADKVIFLYRKKNKESKRTNELFPEGDLILGKNRTGRCGRVRIIFDGPSLTFKEKTDYYTPREIGNGVEPGHGHRDFREPNGG